MTLAHDLAHVQLAGFAHLCRARVAQVRVVLPYHNFRLPALPFKMPNQRLERLGHMTVAQIPGRDPPTKHRAVILFRILHYPRVLLGEKEFVLGHEAIPLCIFGSPPAQLDQLSDYIVLARSAETKSRGVTIGLSVFPEMVKAGIAITRPPGGLRI